MGESPNDDYARAYNALFKKKLGTKTDELFNMVQPSRTDHQGQQKITKKGKNSKNICKNHAKNTVKSQNRYRLYRMVQKTWLFLKSCNYCIIDDVERWSTCQTQTV